MIVFLVVVLCSLSWLSTYVFGHALAVRKNNDNTWYELAIFFFSIFTLAGAAILVTYA